MVPCLGCGKDFCRICDPPRGAGQLCPSCYSDSLERYSGKGQTDKAGRTRRRGKEKKGTPSVTLGSARAAKAPAASGPAPAKETRLARQRSRLRRLDLSGRVRRAASAVARFSPFSLEAKEEAAEVPPFAETWPRLLGVTLAGAALWTVTAVIFHRRLPVVSVFVAILVAAGVVLVLGVGQDLPVAVLATAIALLALVMGEMLVQALYSAEVLKTLDIRGTTTGFVSRGVFFKGFFYNLLILRLLPSAAAAFIVGYWPFPRTLGWKGFSFGRRSGKRA
jgi:hypothetical protein